MLKNNSLCDALLTANLVLRGGIFRSVRIPLLADDAYTNSELRQAAAHAAQCPLSEIDELSLISVEGAQARLKLVHEQLDGCVVLEK